MPGLPNLRSHAYKLCVVTPSRSATSAILSPRSVTCQTASTLNSSVYRLLLMDTSAVAILHGPEMSRKPWAIQTPDQETLMISIKKTIQRRCRGSPHPCRAAVSGWMLSRPSLAQPAPFWTGRQLRLLSTGAARESSPRSQHPQDLPP